MPDRLNEVVLDLETQKTFDEVGGRNIHLLRVSVAGIYCYEKDDFMIFTEGDILNLLPILESTDRVIGFNIKRFDYLVLEPYFKRDLKALPTLDIMEDVQRNLGHRLSLQSLASATLGEGKTGSGLDAIHFFRQGKMNELIEYCKADVRLTRNLYEYGRAHGHLLYRSGLGLKHIPVSW